jgi:transposase
MKKSGPIPIPPPSKKVLKNLRQNYTIKELASILKVSKGTIEKWCASYRIEIKIQPPTKTKFLKLCKTYPNTTVADLLKVNVATIRKWQRLYKIKDIPQENSKTTRKICSYCEQEKSINSFGKLNTRKDGLHYYCKDCSNTISRERRNRNPTAIRKIVQKSKTKTRMENPYKARAQGMARSLNSKTIEVDKSYLTYKFLEKLLRENRYCNCCNKPLKLLRKISESNHEIAVIDRIDSSKGYIKNNIAIICGRCNEIKREGTSKEHRQIADYIDKFLTNI